VASTFLTGVLSPKKTSRTGYCSRYFPWKTSSFFHRVQAITNILAAILTLIFVLIPCSLSRPAINLEKYSTKYLLRVLAMSAA
jgi:hypothetical protein